MWLGLEHKEDLQRISKSNCFFPKFENIALVAAILNHIPQPLAL
jgi:hypothetical protein